MIKNPPASAGDTGDMVSVHPRSGRSPGGGNVNPLQYSCLENSVDRGAWWATVYEVTEESDMTWQLNNNSDYKIWAISSPCWTIYPHFLCSKLCTS